MSTIYHPGEHLFKHKHDKLRNIAWSEAGHTIDADLVPTASGSYDVGTVSLAFNDAHIDKVYLEADPTIPLQATTKQYVDVNYQNKMLADAEYYVDPTGSDITGDGSIGSPFRTIQHCIDITPKSMNGHSLTILINDGTYYESVSIKGFIGGYIDLYSSSYDPEAVTIVQQAGSYAAILAGHNSSTVNIYYLSLLVTQNNGSSVYVYESNVTYISTCLVGQSASQTNTSGITVSDVNYSIDSIADIGGSTKVESGVYLASGAGIADYDTITAGDDYVSVFAPVPLDYTGFIRTPSDAPSSDYHVANKKYVDDWVGDNLVLSGTLLPSASGTFDIGSLDKPFASGCFRKLTVGTNTIEENVYGGVTVGRLGITSNTGIEFQNLADAWAFKLLNYETGIYFNVFGGAEELIADSVVVNRRYVTGDSWQAGGISANLKSGTDQGDAGAAAGELWVDTNDDNTVKMGV